MIAYQKHECFFDQKEKIKFVNGQKIQSIHMKKTIVSSRNKQKKIFEELEISKRTQLPPSDEVIAKLNEIASKPPFSYTQKGKQHDTR